MYMTFNLWKIIFFLDVKLVYSFNRYSEGSWKSAFAQVGVHLVIELYRDRAMLKVQMLWQMSLLTNNFKQNENPTNGVDTGAQILEI